MPDLTPTQATSTLADAASIWRIDPGEVMQVIDAATECLVAGVDSPTLRELAGASPTESQFILEPLIADTFEELGRQDVLTASAQRGALAAMLRRFKEDQMSARDLARWAHSNIGHDGDADCQVFVDLDDMYDVADYCGFNRAELDRWTLGEADAFLEGRPSPGHTGIWRTPT